MFCLINRFYTYQWIRFKSVIAVYFLSIPFEIEHIFVFSTWISFSIVIQPHVLVGVQCVIAPYRGASIRQVPGPFVVLIDLMYFVGCIQS